jgi:hypothetical protein
VLKVGSTSWIDVVILTSHVFGLETFFDGHRTQPVTESQRAEPKVYEALISKRWQGWLAVRRYRESKVYLACVTPVTVSCVPQLDDPECDLRGWCIGLARESCDQRAKLKGRWNNVRADLVKLPHPPDVVAHLQRMWGAPLRRERSQELLPSTDAARHMRALARDVASSLTIPE